jgi:AraC-like DNA-binding protein
MDTDQLSSLLARFNLRAGVFYNGSLCGVVDFGEDGEQGGHLHILRRGQLQVYLADGTVMQVQAPSLLCFPRAVRHRFCVDAGADVDLTCASLRFEGGVGSPIAQAMPELVAMHIDELTHAAQLLAWLFAEAFEPAEGRVAVLNRLCELLIIQILRHLIRAGKAQSGLLAGLAHERLARALEAVHQRPETAWTIETMAAVAGMSRARFASHFRTTLGITPLDYLTGWRLALAQQQLLGGRPMKLIANAVGYDSPSALARTFRRRLGVSPAAWLSRQRPAQF